MSAYFPTIRTALVSQSNGIIEIARNQSGNIRDFGFAGCYNKTTYAGLVRSATDGKFYMFDNLSTSPFDSDAISNTTTLSVATLVIGALTATSLTISPTAAFNIRSPIAVDPIVSFDPVLSTVTTTKSIVAPNIIRAVNVYTANTTLTTNAGICQFNCAAGSITVTLPAAAAAAGIQLYIIKIDDSNNSLTIVGAGSDKVDESFSPVMLTEQWTHTTILCMGSNIGWFSI